MVIHVPWFESVESLQPAHRDFYEIFLVLVLGQMADRPTRLSVDSMSNLE